MTKGALLTGDETEFEGPAGWAKLVPIPDDVPNASENICTWLLFAPGAHPMWSYHALYVIRLRKVAGMSLPNYRFDDANHEFGVLALHPEHQPYTVASYLAHLDGGNGHIPYLMPPDTCTQVACSDEQARILASYAARAVAIGHLVPDSDFAHSWDLALADTLQHIQTGGHDH
ncbi:MAG TPA: hypothetical protein VGR71_16805 [Nitrospira sp.]|nr:hypothetical protein [Nitrospira sp.]